ncbi:hypothetical protein IGL78_002984 [Enterococcus sp. DIV1225]
MIVLINAYDQCNFNILQIYCLIKIVEYYLNSEYIFSEFFY